MSLGRMFKNLLRAVSYLKVDGNVSFGDGMHVGGEENRKDLSKFSACVRRGHSCQFSPSFANGNPNHPLSPFVHTLIHLTFTHSLLSRVSTMPGNGLCLGDIMPEKSPLC